MILELIQSLMARLTGEGSPIRFLPGGSGGDNDDRHDMGNFIAGARERRNDSGGSRSGGIGGNGGSRRENTRAQGPAI